MTKRCTVPSDLRNRYSGTVGQVCKGLHGVAKLRLLVITAFFPPAVGGAAEDFRLLIQAWERLASVDQITILTEKRGDSPTREIRGKIRVHRLLPAARRGGRRRNPIHVIRGLWLYTRLLIATAWRMYTQRSNVVLMHGRYGRKSFLRALKLIGARVVVLVSDHFRPPETFVDCDALVCITEGVYEMVKTKLKDKCEVYYVPLPFECPRPLHQQATVLHADPYFLFLGEISKWKGVDVLLEAFTIFRQDHPDYRLLLAGPVCDAMLIRERPGVTFLGQVSHEKALALIERAEALVLPSRSEGLPRVCLEAIALGTKTVCPPGVPELRRACQEWILSDITAEDVLGKLRQVVSLRFHCTFDFQEYDPSLAGRRIARICSSLLADPLEREAGRAGA